MSDPIAFVERIAEQEARLDAPGWEPDFDPHPEAPGGKAWTGKIYTGGRAGSDGGSWPTYEDSEQTIENVEAICEIRNALPELLRLAKIGASVEASR